MDPSLVPWPGQYSVLRLYPYRPWYEPVVIVIVKVEVEEDEDET